MDEDGKEQIHCLTASAGHLWMRGYYDRLPSTVRQQLAQSRFNVCPACLVLFVEPKVQALHPDWAREKRLFASIQVMEEQARRRRS